MIDEIEDAILVEKPAIELTDEVVDPGAVVAAGDIDSMMSKVVGPSSKKKVIGGSPRDKGRCALQKASRRKNRK